MIATLIHHSLLYSDDVVTLVAHDATPRTIARGLGFEAIELDDKYRLQPEPDP